MKLTDEEIVFLISLLDNRMVYLEREYLHSKKRLDSIYRIADDEDGKKRFESSLFLKKHKMDLCLNILEKLRSED